VFSKRYGISPNTVSRNRSWLVKNGLVGRCHKPVVADDDGKTLSRRLYVWPRLDNIGEANWRSTSVGLESEHEGI
jgi:hypothetical protein